MNAQKDKQDSLLAAVKANNFKETEKLLNNNGLVKDLDFFDYDLLIQALFLGHRKIAKLLLDNGCRVYCIKKTNAYSTPLYYAVKYNCLELVKILLEKGASIKKKDANKETALVLAMKNEYFDIVDLMLSDFSVKNININNEDDVMHFHIAVMRNNTKVVKNFLECGMKVDKISQIKSSASKGYTPLHFAVAYKAIETVKLLLSNKANFGLKNENGSTPLHLAFYLENCEEKNEIINLILSAHLKTMVNPVDKNGISHFHIACSTSNLKSLKAFLKFKADCNSCVFFNAVNLRKSFSSSDILPGYSPLHIAVKYNRKETVQFLLDNKADVNKAVGIGMGVTPLHLSVESDIEIVKLLLKYNADVCATDNENNTAFHKALDKTQINELSETRKAIIHLLFSVHQGNLKNVSNKWGVNLFHIACGVEKDPQVIENFLKQNVNVNACVKKHVLWSSYSALHFAVITGNLEIIQILLNTNISLKMTNSDEHTPLYWVCKHWLNDVINAFSVKVCPTIKLKDEDFEDLQNRLVIIYKNRLQILELFLKREEMHGPIMFEVYGMIFDVLSKTIDPQNELKKLKITQLIEIFKIITITLINHGCDVNKKFKNNVSILHSVIKLLTIHYHPSIIEMIESLLICGAQVDIETEEGVTPLIIAASEGFDEVVDILLKYKADPNKYTKSQCAPLFCALGSSKISAANIGYFVKAAHLLIAKGSKLDIKNSYNSTPLHFAAGNENFHKILLYILERNCKVNSKNLQGDTALHIACGRCNLPAMITLLDYGADINLKNNSNNTPLCVLLIPRAHMIINDIENSEMVKILELHTIKLNYIGYKLNENNRIQSENIKMYFNILQKGVQALYDEKVEDFTCENNMFIDLCKEELQRMKNVKIDSYTSLYSIIFKNAHEVSKNVNNEYLQDLLKLSKLKEYFPLYGYILNLQYKKGLKRHKLLKPAKGVLQTLLSDLPDLCCEQILASFTNQELKRLMM